MGFMTTPRPCFVSSSNASTQASTISGEPTGGGNASRCWNKRSFQLPLTTDTTPFSPAEEKADYDKIRAACFARKAEAEKPKELTEAEKLQLEIEKLTAKLAALQSKKAE